jgi:NAD(P)-dependent dehydrogenase (short-subunit alcohol dehydrogenase family)
MNLTGKPIAITGASSGIGRATALACARAGMPVTVGARREDKLESLVKEITALGGRALAMRVDVDRAEDCRRLIERTIEAFGSVYAVFANAGYGIHKPVDQTTDDEFRAIFETNFYGTLNSIRPALPHMLAARSGHILVCSSCLAKLGAPFHAAYSATKAAQDHVARAMRVELKATGVAVSSIHPIGTRTEFFDRAEQRSTGERNALPSPPAFFMQPAERVANAVVRRLRKGRGGETWTSLPARLAFVAADLFPDLTDWALARATPRQQAKAT